MRVQFDTLLLGILSFDDVDIISISPASSVDNCVIIRTNPANKHIAHYNFSEGFAQSPSEKIKKLLSYNSKEKTDVVL